MKKSLLILIVSLLAAGTAHAVTIDDLLGIGMAIDRANTPRQASSYEYYANNLHNSGGLQIRDTIINHSQNGPERFLMLRNVLNTGNTFLFYISDSKGNMVEDGDYLCYDATADATDWIYRGQFYIHKALESNNMLSACYPRPDGYGGYTGAYTTASLNWFICPITTTSTGYKVTFPYSVHYTTLGQFGAPSKKFSNTQGTNWIRENYTIEFIRPNATMTVEVYDRTGYNKTWGAAKTATWPIHITVTNDGYEILNFCNLGTALNNAGGSNNITESKFKLHTNTDGTVTFDSDGKLMCVSFDNATTEKTVISFTNYGSQWLYSVKGYDNSSKTFSDNVKYEVKENPTSKPRHNSAAHGWVTNGGKRRTFAGNTISLGGFALYAQGTQVTQYFDNIYKSRCYGGADIAIDGDVTLGVDMTLDHCYKNEHAIIATGTMNVLANDKYVDHYELWMLPGHHDNIIGKTDFNHSQYGHTGGMRIDTFDDEVFATETNAAVRRAPAAIEHAVPFAKRIPREMIEDRTLNDNDQYSFYVKAVYKDDSGLTPTFHALNFISAQTVVDDLATPGAFATVSAGSGCIVIEGSDLPAEVYTPSGAQIYTGSDRNIAVAPGLYIVRVGATTAKVLVK